MKRIGVKITSSEAVISDTTTRLNKYLPGAKIPVAMLTQYSETSYTASATITVAHLPLTSMLPSTAKLSLYLKADLYNNGGFTTTVKAIYGDGTAAVTTTNTAYVTLSTTVTVPSVVEGDLELAVDVSGGTAFIKNVTALLLAEPT